VQIADLKDVIYLKRGLNQNLSCNKVHNTDSLLFPAKNMLRSKLHYQKGFNPMLFQYKI